MRGVISLAALLLAAASGAAFGLGCATSVRIQVDERQDFSRLRTWSWLPRDTRTVEAQTPEEASALALRLERLIGEALAAQGFRRTPGPADFLVTYALRVQEQLVTTYEIGAEQEISSLHSAPSWVIQARRTRVVSVETGRLVISAIDTRQKKIVWRGEVTRRAEGAFAPHLADSVARVFESFPIAPAAEPRAPETPGPAPPGLEILTREMSGERSLL